MPHEIARTTAQLQMEQMFLRVQRKLFGEGGHAKTMAHYNVVRPIGQGAMGVVYEAIDTRLGREVALKLVLPELLQTDRGKPRLLREARAMAKIAHPNVVAVYDVGEVSGVVYIAMEYVRGVTIRKWLESPRTLAEILDVFAQSGAGLAAAHRADIVHRDFKPDNVLIGADGRARVLDFGLAFPRVAAIGTAPPPTKPIVPGPAAAAALATATVANAATAAGVASPDSVGSDPNMLVGTIAYMSPEQLQSQPLDGRSDQFSFCVSLYEALFGQRPFSGKTFNDFVEHVWRGELAPVAAPPRLPAWLRALVRRGLAIRPERRFASMTELVSVLTAGRHLLAPPVALPAPPREARDHLLARLGAVADEHVASSPVTALVRVQRLDDHTRRLAIVPHDPRAAGPRATLAAFHERCRQRDAPARLRPIEHLDDEPCAALIFDDVACVTLGTLIRQRADRDLGLALEVAASLTRTVYDLVQLGYELDPAAVEAVPVAVDSYELGPIDPTSLTEARSHAAGRYRIVGTVLQALLTVEVPGDDDRLVPPVVRELIDRLIDRLLDERGGDGEGYRSARGVLHDLGLCLAAHRRGGPMLSFPLGTRDGADRFEVSNVVRGRSDELARFEAMARAIGPGGSGLALVSGPSGIGKSVLIDEMGARLERGWRIQGKFDQYASNEPYATLVQALRGLIRQILDEVPSARDEWRDRIVRAVAPNAGVLFSVIPEIRALIGAQPAAAAMPPVESAARFGETLKRLVAACAAQVDLLVVVLDDMQWSDRASIRLICSLLGDREVGHILWICSFRDNELTPAHPLHELLGAIPARGELRVELPIGPLTRDELAAFLADTLACPPARAAALATFFLDKTDGNPLFARTLLTSLHDQGFFTFSPRSESWSWNDTAIRSAELPDNIQELIARKIEALSPAAREILSVASCVGRDVEADLLLDVVARWHYPRHELVGAVRECVARGLLAASVARPDPDAPELLNFTHDRVQQSAHRFLDPARREAVLLETGRALLERSTPEQIGERLFRIVGYLNGGAAQATGALRERIVELDLAAARRALAANAFADSARFLHAALALLPEDRWTSRYDQTVELYVTAMHAQALLGNRAEEDRLFELLREHVTTTVHLGQIYELKVMLESSRGEHRAAIERGVAGLRALGEKLPAAPGRLAAATELMRTRWALRRLAPDAIPERPSSRREDAAPQRLLVALSAPAYLASPNLLAIVMMRIVRRSLQFGMSEVSSHGFAGFGLIESGLLGRYDRARRYALAAHALDERFGNPWLQPKVDLMSGIFIQPWTQAYEDCEPLLARGARVALANADFVYASYASTSRVCLMFYRGADLAAVAEAATAALRHTRRARDYDMETVVATVIQAVACLRGQTAAADDFTTPDHPGEGLMASLDPATTPVGVFFCRAIRSGVLYLHGRADLACELGAAAHEREANAFSNPSLAELTFSYAMALLRRWPDLGRGERRRARRFVRTALARFAAWAQSCPANFAARHALLDAERARVLGRGAVLDLFNAALEAAVRHERVQYEALAAELAAAHCATSGQGTVGRIYLERAIDAYRRWGAERRAEQLALTLDGPP